MRHQNRTSSPPGSRDPQLGGQRAAESDLSGMEPLLGGLRRTGPDLTRIQALLDAPDEETRNRLLAQATRMGQARLYAEELALVIPARARHRMGNYRGTFTPTQRVAAMRALEQIGNAASIPALLSALADGIYEVRSAANTTLTAICARLDPGDQETRAALRTMVLALGPLSMSGRKVVARLLAASEPDLVLKPLLAEGLTSPEWCARREAAWVLGMLGDVRATKRLIAVLTDASPAVRAAAAWALGRFDAPVAIEPLAQAAQDDDEVVRAAAIEALGTHVARLVDQDGNFQPVLDTVVTALDDEDWSVRHSAADALIDLDTPQARLALQARLNR